MDRLAWLKARQQGLGGSDIAAVAGVSPYQSAWALYWSKILPPDEEPPSEAALWGQLLEEAVVVEWARRAGQTVQRSDWLHQHAHHDWWLGTPDGLVLDDEGVPTAGLEIKLVGEDAWRYSWDGGAVIPVHYQVQCQWYLGLTGLHQWHLAALVGGRRLEQFTIDRDDRALARLEEIGREFWFDHVLPQTPPPPDGSERTRDLLDEIYPAPRDPPVACRLPHDAAELINAYHDAARAEKDAARAKAEVQNQLIALLGQHEATDGYLPEQGDDEPPAVTYRPTRIIDTEALADEVGLSVVNDCLRVELDVKALERAVGRKTLDDHRKPGPTRRLHVRAPREDTQ